jgi:hypothetical protein
LSTATFLFLQYLVPVSAVIPAWLFFAAFAADRRHNNTFITIVTVIVVTVIAHRQYSSSSSLLFSLGCGSERREPVLVLAVVVDNFDMVVT